MRAVDMDKHITANVDEGIRCQFGEERGDRGVTRKFAVGPLEHAILREKPDKLVEVAHVHTRTIFDHEALACALRHKEIQALHVVLLPC
ncbi:hypothetical protein CHELA40_11932 [Chelatococcus asaccharovorans]|nr:hypothetical protein CHELA40_11932 [Chelatococcus asaccharovorans]